ncbi:unnamed protein product, partial [marine sediment metagenome]
MGHIKDIKSNLDPQAFPGATFEIAGEVPASQCSEAKIEGTKGATIASQDRLTDPGKFTGYNLAGKHVTVTSPPENAGKVDAGKGGDVCDGVFTVGDGAGGFVDLGFLALGYGWGVIY